MRTEATEKVACENAVRILFFDERQTHVQVKIFKSPQRQIFTEIFDLCKWAFPIF